MTDAAATGNENETLTGDAKIVQEAVERFKACKDFQGVSDERTREDIKFANGDSRNAWQWPTKIYQERTGGSGDDGLPCLTINNTRVHNDMIINAMSKNRYGIKVRPTGGKSTYESAQIMQGIIRRIEYISRFPSQKRKVAEQQVDGGIGYIIIETNFVSERSFDQDIKLRASRDPTGVYLDPDIREPDGSDANYGFIFDLMSRKKFNRQYPKFENKIGLNPIGSMFADWISSDKIMLAKYFRKKDKSDTLVAYPGANGDQIERLKSEIVKESGQELYDRLIDDIENGRIDGKTRSVKNNQVEWFLIGGDTIIDHGPWAGKYIPICRCVGRELIIDNTLDRKGHTRPLIDSQRMLNYNGSMAVQDVAIQTKSPWLAPARAIEGQEGWKTANIDNFAVLQYNDVDDEADGDLQKIAPPQKIDRPAPSPAYQQGMENAERHMMMVSGQFQAQMGENDQQSAASGRAIGERQQQGDTATYHFVEHQSDMLTFIGVQLLDLIPKIYDTERTLHIIDEKNKKSWIMIDPNQDNSVKQLEHDAKDEEAIKFALNPKQGEYECVSDPGPDYATQRQEASEKIGLIMGQNKELAAIAADLLFKYSDFPGAEEIRERLEKEIKATKPYLFDDNLDPALSAAQQQNQRLIALNAELMNKLAEEQLRRKGREEKRDIDAFNADTTRFKAQSDVELGRLKIQMETLAKVMLTPDQRLQYEHEMQMGLRDQEHELRSMGHQHVYDVISQTNQADLDAENAAKQPNGGAS